MPKRKQHRFPKQGAIFERKWRGKLYRLRIMGNKTGGVAFEVDGQPFASPSAAAKSITKQEVNGWRFWHID